MNRPKPDPAVVALARDMEQLKERVAQVEAAVGEAQRLAEAAHRVLPELADRIAAAAQARTMLDDQVDLADSSASWLADPRPARLADLRDWLAQVLIHYPGTAEALAPCWPLHPWIVEELLALQWAWTEAYEGERASGTRAVEWHDRLRPAVVGRIGEQTAGCSVDAHRPGGRLDTPSKNLPGADQIGLILEGGVAKQSR